MCLCSSPDSVRSWWVVHCWLYLLLVPSISVTGSATPVVKRGTATLLMGLPLFNYDTPLMTERMRYARLFLASAYTYAFCTEGYLLPLLSR